MKTFITAALLALSLNSFASSDDCWASCETCYEEYQNDLCVAMYDECYK